MKGKGKGFLLANCFVLDMNASSNVAFHMVLANC